MHTIICPAEKHLEAIDEKARRNRIPLSAHIDITYSCNLKCAHCYCRGLSGEFTGGRPEMPTERIVRLIDELAEAGTLNLAISGGEMLVHPDFFGIARHAKRRHFCLSFITNGTLIDDTMAGRLTELAPRLLQLSLYGTTASTHDSVTGSAGSFEKTVKAVKLLKSLGNRITLSTTIMTLNFHEAKDIPRFAAALGADRHIWTAEISRKNDGSRAPQRYQIGEREIRELYAALDAVDIPTEPAGDPLESGLCRPGETNCCISAHGDIYPCAQLIYPMGNVQERSFAGVWREDSIVRRELGSVRRFADMPACRSCDYVASCQKCLGIAYLETKDMRRCYNTLKMISKAEYELRQKAVK